jgi:starch phosphorylase
VDVWLNNPIAPLEASGTSGIKAAVNGRLNLSVLDGWWAEAWDGDNGWGLPGSTTQDPWRRDQIDAETVLDAIEEEVAPLYYARNNEGISPGWVQRSRHAMASVLPRFNIRRTICDYARGMYAPAAQHGALLASQDGARAAELAAWKHKVREHWKGVHILSVEEEPRGPGVTAPLRMRVSVDIDGLAPADLRVEFKARRILPEASFDQAPLSSFGHPVPNGQWRAEFTPTGQIAPDGGALYEVAAVPPVAGQYQLEVRVYPWHELLSHPLEMGLMKSV